MNRNSVWQVMLLAVVFLGTTAAQIARSEGDGVSHDQVTGEIKYRFVGHLEQVDEKGRLLVWEAQVAGDIQGTMKWWFVNPPPVTDTVYAGGRLSFYAARWELWYEEELLLAGLSAGKTDFRDGADGIWDGHGRVTEARGKYESLRGRSVYESGPVILGSEPPATLTGTGVFLIY